MTQVFLCDASFLKKEADYRAALNAVTEDRRKKTERYLRAEDQRVSLCAELLLRYALSSVGYDGPLDFSYGENGKPELTDASAPRFNLSHAGTRVLLILGDTPVGCDIERMRPGKTELADRFFSEEECRLIRKKTREAEKKSLFFTFWTLKESFLKATGRGLSLPLRSFTVQLKRDFVCLKQNTVPASYLLFRLPAPRGYRAACCIQTNLPLPCPTVTVVSGNDLVKKPPYAEKGYYDLT